MGIKDLLENEMKASHEFSKSNFGAQVGAAYPELVKEVSSSDPVCATLMVELCIAGITGKQVADSLKKHNDSKDLQKAILENLPSFNGQLSMLYWGINIGRKLEKESLEVNKLEEMFGGK